MRKKVYFSVFTQELCARWTHLQFVVSIYVDLTYPVEFVFSGDEKMEAMQLSSGELEMGEIKLVTSVRGSMGERIIKSLAKVEEKKRKRLARQNQVQILSDNHHNIMS